MAGKKNPVERKTWHLAGEPVYPIKLSTSDENTFSENFSFQRDITPPGSDSMLQVSNSTMKVRESAARASLGFLCKRFEGRYRQSEIVEAVSIAASLHVCITERCAQSTEFLLGAALWLLDYIDRRRLDNQFLPLLPKSVDSGLIFHLPMVDDFSHSSDDVLRLMTALCNRNGTEKAALRNILRLIDKETAAALREAFLDCFLDYFGRYMEVCTRVKRPAIPAGRPLPSPELSPLSGSGRFSAEADSLLSSMRSNPDVTFLLLTPGLIGASDDELKSELYFRRSVDLLRGFTVSDPYAICAAYLLLEKEGDALVSLNTLTGAVITCAERHLPWGAGEPQAWPRTFQDGTPDYDLRYMFAGSDEEQDETNELPACPVEDGQRLSEAQLFYLTTGYALPRNRIPSQELIDWFVKQGLTEERSREFTFGAMLAVYQDNLRDLLSLEPSFDDFDDDDDSDGEAAPQADPEVESQNEARITDLTRQVKELRRALYESERTARQFQEQLLEEERQSARERMELTQLRDILYQIRSGEEQSDRQSETVIELPWQVTRRVLIFGGHDTWLKAIRPMLPGARFFEKESLPDLNVLKNADVVWIQSNAISHKFFYRVIHAARKENIPVRYFGFASARKCAEQLVLDEIAECESES